MFKDLCHCLQSGVMFSKCPFLILCDLGYLEAPWLLTLRSPFVSPGPSNEQLKVYTSCRLQFCNPFQSNLSATLDCGAFWRLLSTGVYDWLFF